MNFTVKWVSACVCVWEGCVVCLISRDNNIVSFRFLQEVLSNYVRYVQKMTKTYELNLAATCCAHHV